MQKDRAYHTKYLANIFPSTLSSTLHIHFYLHLKELSENVLWIVIALKSATFSAPKGAPKIALETTYLCYFIKTWLKSGIKCGNYVCFDETDQFYTYIFLDTTCFVVVKNSLAMYSRRKVMFMKPRLFFRRILQIICISDYLLKSIIRVAL